MSEDLRASQLKALRATLSAAMHQVDAMLFRPSDVPCDHPIPHRRDMSTMGHPRSMCGDCGTIIEGEAA